MVEPAPRLRALKSLGQHFLVDKGIVRRIAAAGHVQGGDTVVEVGPGKAILTDALLETGADVVALELDRGLHAALAQRFPDEPRLTLHHADALKFDLSHIPTPYKVVANLPYQVTTPLLFHFLQADPAPTEIVVTIQLEVAQRILAGPGSKAYGVLSLGVQARGEARMCFKVSPGAFRPPPKVKSAVIRITPRENPALPTAQVPRFMSVVRAALGNRRKTLRNALGTLGHPNLDDALAESGIAPTIRGEKLDLEAFVTLTRALYPPD